MSESFIDRINKEIEELSIKLEKLTEFRASSKFTDLSKDSQFDLIEQHQYMLGYYSVLKRRINKLTKERTDV